MTPATETPKTLPELAAANERLRDNIAKLLQHVGKPDTCKGCKKPVWWMFHRDSGKWQIYDQDALPHWATCPSREQFKRTIPNPAPR